MNNTLSTTVAFIILSTIVAAFVKRRTKDKCLKDFSQDVITLEKAAGNALWGKLNVENNGLEFIYPEKQRDENGCEKTSYILYKNEYPNIALLARYHDQLSEESRQQRLEELKKTYHPEFSRRLKRKTLNVFKTLRDAMMDLVNLIINQAKKATPAGAILASQDKYVSQMKQELVSSAGTAYEPLLEKYIGHKVVLEMLRADKRCEYCGVLKDYTADFIAIMDVNYKSQPDETVRIADLVISRKYGIVRHLAE